jgi:hypothetical protein
MTYALTFLAGVAVAAVLMWYYAGIVTKSARNPKARLEYNAIAIACALIRAGMKPADAIEESVDLAHVFGDRIDKEF